MFSLLRLIGIYYLISYITVIIHNLNNSCFGLAGHSMNFVEKDSILILGGQQENGYCNDTPLYIQLNVEK